MQTIFESWDYLIVTASNPEQAAAYEKQLTLRTSLGLLTGIKEVLTIPDPKGKRIGSGGSTIFCIKEILAKELSRRKLDISDSSLWLKILQGLRILIVHAGGDSKRLPVYGPCGKIFLPIPGKSDSALDLTLFDRQISTYLQLPRMPSQRGQIIITSGDVLLSFNPLEVKFADEGITGLACHTTPEEAMNHGVFCPADDSRVRLFLQKPSVDEQTKKHAVNRHGQSTLDIGVMNIDASAAVSLLRLSETKSITDGEPVWSGAIGNAIENFGIDFYREICCAMGTEVTFSHYIESVRQSGSKLEERDLKRIFDIMSPMPFSVNVVPRCGFLHFGTLRQIIDSGIELLNMDYGVSSRTTCLSVNNDVSTDAQIVGVKSWVEGCRIKSKLILGGDNVVVGLDIEQPLQLPEGVCLDMLSGSDRYGKKTWFIRYYGINDKFKESVDEGATLCNRKFSGWLRSMGAKDENVWDKNLNPHERDVWNVRIFPAISNPSDFRKWLWVYSPSDASEEQRAAWLAADRYSLSEISRLANMGDFYRRREQIRVREIIRSWRQMFGLQSGFTAKDLAFLFGILEKKACVDFIIDILKQNCIYFENGNNISGSNRLDFSRIIHTLGTAISLSVGDNDSLGVEIVREIKSRFDQNEKHWFASRGVHFDEIKDIQEWIASAHDAAFNNLGVTIVLTKNKLSGHPKNALRSDEIIWGRAPARLDLGGGWTDTPPYALEHGGRVINAAVNLNSQPPIHIYARIISEPIIRITSIDHGVRLTIEKLDDLLDYRRATSEFGLAKAALVLSGFSPEMADWPNEVHTLKEMLELFGGGIELTTLAAIPSGSGLGTSSIMGAVLISVVNRFIGRKITQRELFNSVLQLEQELTTGGGWQDQIGGTCEGVKVITTDAGMIPDPRIHHVLPALLDPKKNNGQTLLYYTGIRRLAKNILRSVVGNYLNRDRAAVATLKKLYALPPLVADAMALKDMKRFGELIDVAWRLNNEIDPDSTTDVIEEILAKIKPYIYGAKLLGAGGGGFLLMVCKSPEDASVLRKLLELEPPNDRARFFEYDISTEGLVVTIC